MIRVASALRRWVSTCMPRPLSAACGLVGLIMLTLPMARVQAQSGKVAGTVTDGITGEPLPGVNVVIEGTLQGTSTGVDGTYVIIGVRPGTYSVVASFIGFATQRREEVRVSVDLTTPVDFRMREEIIEGEEVIVTADAVAVRKDLTSSEARITAETIDKLPVTELSQILDVQAGVTTRGGIHVRGGRSSEVLFMVDGVPISDSYDGSSVIQLENDGIQELQVISGTFNAEYGNAMSGVVNVVTKEGSGDRLSGSVRAYAGGYAVGPDAGGRAFLQGTQVEEFSEAGIQYRDVDPYSYLPFRPDHFRNAAVSLEGPIWNDRVTFFALGRFFDNDGWLYGTRLFAIDGSAGDSSLVPMNNFEKLSWQGNLRVRLGRKLVLNVIGLGSSTDSRPYSLSRRWAPDGRFRSFDDGYNVKIKLTHLLSPRTFYTLDVGTFYREAKGYRFEDPFDSRYNDFDVQPPDSVEYLPGQYLEVLSGNQRYSRGGTNLFHFERTSRSMVIKGDLSSQLTRHHLVKTGFQVRIDQLALTGFGLIPALDEHGERIEPFQPAIPSESSVAYSRFDDLSPLTVSAYAQDKMEFDDFIVNAGVRFDYFDARAHVPADPSDPNIFNPLKLTNRFRDANGDGVVTADEEIPGNVLTPADREGYWWKEVEPKLQVSPRLGVAYPITEEGVVHFSYGIFFQIPTQNRLFENFGFKMPALSGSYGPFGNPDLDAQKTTMYEIGFKQGLGPFVVDVTGYYRDVRNWVSTSQPILAALPGISYVIYTNRDYANTRGLTVDFSRRFADRYGFDVSYTYQVVEGSNSNPADEFFALQNNDQPSLALLPLNWDQRHKLAGAFYVGGDAYGGSIRFRYESGFPYTPTFASAALVGNDVQPEFPSNSRRLPTALEVDLNLYKEFPVGRLRPRVFLEAYNVLDARNVVGVFADTGEADVTLDQLRTGQFDPGYYVRPEHYREPRRVQMGLEVRF